MNQNIGQHAEGRVVHPAAILQLALREAGVVVSAGGNDGVVVGIVGLHDDAAGQFTTACAARDLRHQLKDPFRGAEVRHRQRVIAADNADQRDAVNVVALSDHLRPDEQVNFAGVEAREQMFEIVASTDSIAVHAADARAGKDFREAFFALLRSGAEVVEVLALAVGTFRRDDALESAVVAFQPLSRARDLVFAAAACDGSARWRSSGTRASARRRGR